MNRMKKKSGKQSHLQETQKIKYLEINLMREVKTSTMKSVSYLRKKLKKTSKIGKIYHAYGLAE
jgi:hypothetical protein